MLVKQFITVPRWLKFRSNYSKGTVEKKNRSGKIGGKSFVVYLFKSNRKWAGFLNWPIANWLNSDENMAGKDWQDLTKFNVVRKGMTTLTCSSN
jgi:hypothetical protein